MGSEEGYHAHREPPDSRLRAAHEFSGSDNVVVLAEAKRRFTRLDGGDAA